MSLLRDRQRALLSRTPAVSFLHNAVVHEPCGSPQVLGIIPRGLGIIPRGTGYRQSTRGQLAINLKRAARALLSCLSYPYEQCGRFPCGDLDGFPSPLYP